MNLDFAHARENMVEQQIRPWDVLDVRVLDVISKMPREAFVAEPLRGMAYADLMLPIGHGETMLKPVLEGRALQSLLPSAAAKVLVIGTGSGYLTACFAALAREVISIERDPELAAAAAARLQQQGFANTRVLTADAFSWTPETAFDVICVTGAVASIPARFIDWLTPNGRMFLVRGQPPVMEAVLVQRDGNDARIESLFETELPYLKGAEPEPVFTL